MIQDIKPHIYHVEYEEKTGDRQNNQAVESRYSFFMTAGGQYDTGY